MWWRRGFIVDARESTDRGRDILGESRVNIPTAGKLEQTGANWIRPCIAKMARLYREEWRGQG